MAIAQYSSQKKYPPPKGEGDFLVLQRGFEPRTPCLKGVSQFEKHSILLR